MRRIKPIAASFWIVEENDAEDRDADRADAGARHGRARPYTFITLDIFSDSGCCPDCRRLIWLAGGPGMTIWYAFADRAAKERAAASGLIERVRETTSMP
jgi:hypothetical protein